MIGSLVVYLGLVLIGAGVVRWVVRRWRSTPGSARPRLAVPGLAATLAGFLLPAPETTVVTPSSHLDSIAPSWQFNEFHTATLAAAPETAYRAAALVRADEIRFFRLLTWIRRGGRSLPDNILDAGDREPLIDVAVRGGFVCLVNDPPAELVFGSAVVWPRSGPRPATPEAYRAEQPPGTVLATMNFRIIPEGSAVTITTETRVYANTAAARRRFAVYWRLIYPGSALIRRMWLGAIARRASAPNG